MNQAAKSLVTAGVVVATIGAGLLGSSMRARVDTGDLVAKSGDVSRSVFASASNSKPATESEAFYDVAQVLMREYVEPVELNSKMAIGSVKGMINSLSDPDSVFFSPEAFASHQRRLKGEFEGVGAEVSFVYNQEELKKLQNEEKNVDSLMLLPDVVFTAILPGSTAEKAGLKSGDRVLKINGKWVISADDIKKVRAIGDQVTAKTLPPEALEKARSSFNEKVRNNMVPNKVRDLLTVGEGNTLLLTVLRGTTEIPVSVATSKLTVPPAELTPEGTLRLRVFTQTPDALKKMNIDWSKVKEIDLRQSTGGDSAAILNVMEIIAPKGNYGMILAENEKTGPELKVQGGVAQSRPIPLLVDSSTTGAAAVLAGALSGSKIFPLQGELAERKAPWIKVFNLPDGSGYTLKTGHLQPVEVAS